MEKSRQLRNNFEMLVREHIKREGIEDLLEWLGTTDFYTAPASTMYHGDHECGLVEHSINVWKLFNTKFLNDMPNFNKETRAICALFHDLCKINSYTVSTRNVKNETTGQWEKVPFYKSNVTFPYGHGEKSVYILMQFIKLTPEEAMAINWHMGGFDSRCKGGSYDLSTAFEMSPLAVELHIADLRATYLLESKTSKDENGNFTNIDWR